MEKIMNDDNYTHAIIMNTAMPNLTIPKENVIGLAFEPPIFLSRDPAFTDFIHYSMSNISKYFIGSNDGLPANFIEHYSYMWHITPPRTLSRKDKLMSIMVSEKKHAPGHIFRHTLVKEILRSNLNIDIYGRGCRYYTGDSRLKNDFHDNEPYENYQTPCYTSEKYTNLVLWGTTPIYWGATNIDAVFPEITINLSGDSMKDINLTPFLIQNAPPPSGAVMSVVGDTDRALKMRNRCITDIIYHPNKYRTIFSQTEIRPKINILKNLDNIFSK